MKSKVPAFTLLELLLVLTSILILTSLSIPYFFNHGKHNLLHDLEKLETVFTHARHRAIATNQLHTLEFDLTNHAFSLTSGSKKTVFQLSSGISFGFLPTALGPPSHPKNPIKSAISFKSPQKKEGVAVFFPNGQVCPGAVYLLDAKNCRMGALTCAVSQVSYIRRYLYTKPNNSSSPDSHWQLLT